MKKKKERRILDPYHVRYRPQTLGDVIGQPSAVTALENLLQGQTIPHAYLFTGPSGVVLVGVAQERAQAWTATKQVRGRHIHFVYRRKSLYVNHYYIYLIDPAWGPAFIKVCGLRPLHPQGPRPTSSSSCSPVEPRRANWPPA